MLRTLTKPIRNRGLRWRLTSLGQRIRPVSPYVGRKLDAYWLSMGRSGTHFIHHVLSTATNVHSLHEGGVLMRDVFRAAKVWKEDPERFWSLRLEDLRGGYIKVMANARPRTEVFVNLSHAMHVFGYMMYDFYERRTDVDVHLKLIHLVRNPIDACRSNLKVERDESEGGDGFRRRPEVYVRGSTSAEKAANIWNDVNMLCREIVERIDSANHARTVRIEDVDADLLEELFDFLELRGFNRARIEGLVESRAARYSHVARSELNTKDATEQELAVVRQLTAPLAAQFGYQT